MRARRRDRACARRGLRRRRGDVAALRTLAGGRGHRLHPPEEALEGLAEHLLDQPLRLLEERLVVRAGERVVVDEVARVLLAEVLVHVGEEDELVPVVVEGLRRRQVELRADRGEIHEPLGLELELLGLRRVLRVALREGLGHDVQVVGLDRLPERGVVRHGTEVDVDHGSRDGRLGAGRHVPPLG